jgi:hypothetical protein
LPDLSWEDHALWRDDVFSLRRFMKLFVD